MAPTLKFCCEEDLCQFPYGCLVQETCRHGANIGIVVLTRQAGDFGIPAIGRSNLLVLVQRHVDAVTAATKSNGRGDVAFVNSFAKRMGIVGIVATVGGVGSKIFYFVPIFDKLVFCKLFHFKAGMVGGHCIGVDPYYFIYQAEKYGGHAPIVTAARQTNEGMSAFVTGNIVRELIRQKIDVAKARIVLFGMTFKENCPDTRNSRAVDIYRQLQSYGIEPLAVDPHVDATAFQREFGISLHSLDSIHDADALVFLVAHREYVAWNMANLCAMVRSREEGRPVLVDVKRMFNRADVEAAGFSYWGL